MMTITAAVFGLFLTACTTKGTDTLPAGTCDNSADCPDGAICLDNGTCKVTECLDSPECKVEQYCNATFSCVDGCEADSDCNAGDACDTTTNTCVTYGCRDTQLDCNYGEICDTTSGTCNPDDQSHCETCSVTSPGNSCGNGSECVAFSSTSCRTTSDCAQGELCDEFTTGRYCHADYCLVRCRDGDEAPRGFTCGDVFGDGSLTAFVGDCPWLLENGL
jgi:hypothetical protein